MDLIDQKAARWQIEGDLFMDEADGLTQQTPSDWNDFQATKEVSH